MLDKMFILNSETTFFFALLLFFLIGLFQKNKISYLSFVDFCFWNATLILLLTLSRLLQNNIFKIFVFNSLFFIDPLILSIELICLIFMLILIWGSYDYFRNAILPVYEFTCLVLFSLLGLFFLLKANDLFVLYLSIEVQSMALYILVVLRSNSNYAIEAGLKYYIFSVFLTLCLLFGISLLYSELGTITFNDLNLILAENFVTEFENRVKFGILFIVCGLLFKLAIFPFHGWIADIYLGANLACVGFLATIPKIIFLFTLIKIIFLFSFVKFELSLLLGILGSCSIIIGTIVGLYQVKILRVLAFSAMVNIGYIVLAISLQSIEGLIASIYSMVVYSLGILGIFLILMSYRSKDMWEIKFIVDLREILKVNKLIAFIFAMFIFSLAGLPPFAGFCGKFFIFLAMIKQGEYLYVVILFLFSILTAVYYLRLIRFLYFSNQFSLINMQNIKISAIVSFIIVIFFLINIFLFLFQAPLILVITNLIIENLFLDK